MAAGRSVMPRTSHRLDPRRVKLHLSYTIEEAARALGVHRNPIRNWVRAGLTTVDGGRPTLILGRALKAFLEQRRQSSRTPCGFGELFCVRCRSPQRPAGDAVDYLPTTANSGNLQGICPDCSTMIHRCVRRDRLAEVAGDLEIAFPGGQ
ncbi:MAG: helix-turn-helix domain-containing protein [Alphaproteobacteria bacterium]